MTCFPQKTFVAVMGVVLAVALASPSTAQEEQQRQRRSFFEVPRVSLASLPEVQAELKLNEAQKTLADSLQEKLNEDRREVFQSGGGDWDAMREKVEKLNSEATAKLMEKLDPGQQKRLTEIFVQANGPSALADKEVMEQLKINDEQKKQLEEAREDNRYAFMDAWQDFQGMTPEERRDAIADLQKEADERLLKPLDENQREQFAKLSGKELDYDLTPLMPRRGG
jgi:hypothetical protein